LFVVLDWMGNHLRTPRYNGNKVSYGMRRAGNVARMGYMTNSCTTKMVAENFSETSFHF